MEVTMEKKPCGCGKKKIVKTTQNGGQTNKPADSVSKQPG